MPSQQEPVSNQALSANTAGFYCLPLFSLLRIPTFTRTEFMGETAPKDDYYSKEQDAYNVRSQKITNSRRIAK